MDDQCGWLIPAGSEDALVEAMGAALQLSPDELEAKGAGAANASSAFTNVDRNAEALLAAIKAMRPPA